MYLLGQGGKEKGVLIPVCWAVATDAVVYLRFREGKPLVLGLSALTKTPPEFAPGSDL